MCIRSPVYIVNHQNLPRTNSGLYHTPQIGFIIQLQAATSTLFVKFSRTTSANETTPRKCCIAGALTLAGAWTGRLCATASSDSSKQDEISTTAAAALDSIRGK